MLVYTMSQFLIYLHVPLVLAMLALHHHVALFATPDLASLGFLLASSHATFTHVQFCESFLALVGMPKAIAMPIMISVAFSMLIYVLCWIYVALQGSLLYGLAILACTAVSCATIRFLLGIEQNHHVHASIRMCTVFGCFFPAMCWLATFHVGFALVVGVATLGQAWSFFSEQYRDGYTPTTSLDPAVEDWFWFGMVTTLGQQVCMVLVGTTQLDARLSEVAIVVGWVLIWCLLEWNMVLRLQRRKADFARAKGGVGLEEKLLPRGAAGLV